MKLHTRFLYLSVSALLLLTSCAKEPTESPERQEKQSLEAWMTQHRSDLVGNYQEEGGYYVEVLDAGDPAAEPIGDTAQWVRYDFSGRDLNGNIVLTRNAAEATLNNTFTKYTHYVPYYRFCGEENMQLVEGTYLAMRNQLTLGDNYYEAHKADLGLTSPELQMRIGSKVRLYLPSSVVGGLAGDGGYQGQFSLDADKPCIITMQITDTVANPLEREGRNVDDFAAENGGVQHYGTKADAAEDVILRPTDPADPNHAYNIAARWVSACDSIPQLYVDVRYEPTEKLIYPNPYTSGEAPYVSGNSVQTIDEQITEALEKRFHGAQSTVGAYPGVQALEADSIKTGKANIWYIGRFLDGFIFDTNIDEVKQIIYGEVTTPGTALSYTPPSDNQSSSSSLIEAFNYVMPNLKYGQWAELITTSTYAYGMTGVSGSSTTSSSGYSDDYYDYMNYLNYQNMYYGNGGYYGGYYGDYYGGGYGGYPGYYGGYYGDYGYPTDTGTQTTTTTISTEIAPYTPLIFQFYIEPAAAE